MTDDLAAGYRVGGRYRLEARLGTGGEREVWRATDERLERQVAVRLFARGLSRDELEDRAAAAASLTHPRVVRLFDTGFDRGRFYTVTELLPGSLGWARLPLSATEAVEVAVQVAEALAYAHEHGVVHGELHPGNVLLSEQGAKVGDFALAGRRDGEPSRDLVALGALLYRMLTGRDPGSSGEGRLLTDEPRGVAAVTMRLLDGGYRDADEVAADLRSLRPAPAAPVRRRPPMWAVAAAGALLVVVGLGATRLAGGPPREPRSTAPPRITGTPYAVATVSDFDPLGDGREGRRTVAKIADGDPQTFWSTERYSASADFSGLKDGVGVILDLGSPRTVAAAQVLFASPGCSVEIRYSDVRARDVSRWTTAASMRSAGQVGAVQFSPVTSRWWLVWVNELAEGVPGARGSFACAVAEAELYPPA